MAADWQTEEDLAEFQELSNKYEPEATVSAACVFHNQRSAIFLTCIFIIQGPLVGERQSSNALTTEYAAADPIYQAKTAVS